MKSFHSHSIEICRISQVFAKTNEINETLIEALKVSTFEEIVCNVDEHFRLHL